MKAPVIPFRTAGTRRSGHCRTSGGFTLVEIVVVVAIVGLLAAAAQPLLALQSQRRKELDLRQGLRSLRTAIDAYRQAAAEGRMAPPDNDGNCPPDLATLVGGVADLKMPGGKKIYFLRRLPRDPFADPAAPPELTWGLRSYESPPDAPQPGKDVFDVHSQAEGIGLDGTPYRDW